MALRLSGAVEIQRKDYPDFYNLVENLAISQGIPTPRVYLIYEDEPNAFACGMRPEKAFVAATTGLITSLKKREVEAVMAHEVGHIMNYDTRVKTVVFALIGAIAVIAQFFWICAIASFAGSGFRRNRGAAVVAFIGLACALVAAFASLFAFVLGPIVKALVSRQREYLADASGALITRDPDSLASALLKIDSNASVSNRPTMATSHFYFSKPKSNAFLGSLLSTHPTTQNRVARLRKMASSF